MPGGVVDAPLASAATLQWIARQAAGARLVASVCTGVFLLAASGVVTDEAVTTHWEDMADLRERFPALEVREGVRWVDGGRILSSAGISAGIDMSLHLVERPRRPRTGRAHRAPDGLRMDAQPTLIRVVFVLLPGSAWCSTGPGRPRRCASPTSGCAPPGAATLRDRVREPAADTVGSVGIALTRLAPLPDLPAANGAAWVVLVGMPGDTIPIDNARDPGPAALAARPAAGARARLELLTICAGSLLAAHAGALAGRRAPRTTITWTNCAPSSRAARWWATAVFVLDPPVYSSAGVTTGIDLLLHRIADTCGEALAAQVAQTMVVALRRGPHDPELSPFPAYRNHLHAALHRVQDAVSERPQADWNDAAHGRGGPHLGAAPDASVRGARGRGAAGLPAPAAAGGSAQLALASGASVTRAAELSGFGSDTQLRLGPIALTLALGVAARHGVGGRRQRAGAPTWCGRTLPEWARTTSTP